MPVGSGFAGQIAATRAPVRLDDVGPHTVVNPILWQKGVHSMLGVPLIAEGRLLGVMHVGTLEHRHFSDAEVGTLEREADRVARLVSVHQALAERLTAQNVAGELAPGPSPRPRGTSSSLPDSSPPRTSASVETGSTCSGCPTVTSASSWVTSPGLAYAQPSS